MIREITSMTSERYVSDFFHFYFSQIEKTSSRDQSNDTRYALWKALESRRHNSEVLIDNFVGWGLVTFRS